MYFGPENCIVGLNIYHAKNTLYCNIYISCLSFCVFISFYIIQTERQRPWGVVCKETSTFNRVDKRFIVWNLIIVKTDFMHESQARYIYVAI
jgi:hypothetical protein